VKQIVKYKKQGNIMRNAITKASLIGLAFMCLGQLSANAQEQSDSSGRKANFYVDFGTQLVKVQQFDGTAVNAIVRGGTEFTKNLAAELELGIGLGNSGGSQVEFDGYGAGFLVAKAPVAENSEVFARAGYSYYDVKGDSGDSAAAFGVGARWNFVRLDYTYVDTDTGAHVVGLSFGARF
jgi:hypothetical protein